MNEKKRIAIVIGQLNTGGTETALVNMLKRLNPNKYYVELWIKEGGDLSPDRIPNEVVIRHWDEDKRKPHRHTLQSLWYRYLSKRNISDFNRNLKYYIKSREPLSAVKYDKVICYYGYSEEVIFTSLYRFRAKERVLWVHGHYNRNRSDHSFWKKEYNRFQKIICVSQSNRELFLSRFSDLYPKTEVIYNVLDTDQIRQLSEESVDYEFDDYTLVTVGRLSQEKGQDIIPEIASKLIKKGIPIRWYIIGDGPLRQTIAENVTKFGVEENVFLIGQKENPYPFMKKSAVYVQTSLMEGYCMTTLEAKALNKTVVTTDVPGMREQFEDGKTGIIVKNRTADALSSAIESVLADPKRLDSKCKHPLYSVIVPVYNVEDVVGRCIESVLGQEFTDFELLLIDDGSSDNSFQICREYAKEDDRIKVFHQENAGVSSARNKGLSEALGKYIVFVDSDDYVDADYISSLTENESELVICGFDIRNERGKLIKQRTVAAEKERTDKEGLLPLFQGGILNSVYSKRYLTDIIHAFHIQFDENMSLGEDSCFVLDYLKHVHVYSLCPAVSYHYVQYDSKETLSSKMINCGLIDKIEKVCFALEPKLQCMLGDTRKSTTALAVRYGELYKTYMELYLVDDPRVSRHTIKHMTKQYWYKRFIKEKVLFAQESKNHRAIIRLNNNSLINYYKLKLKK